MSAESPSPVQPRDELSPDMRGALQYKGEGLPPHEQALIDLGPAERAAYEEENGVGSVEDAIATHAVEHMWNGDGAEANDSVVVVENNGDTPSGRTSNEVAHAKDMAQRMSWNGSDGAETSAAETPKEAKPSEESKSQYQKEEWPEWAKLEYDPELYGSWREWFETPVYERVSRAQNKPEVQPDAQQNEPDAPAPTAADQQRDQRARELYAEYGRDELTHGVAQEGVRTWEDATKARLEEGELDAALRAAEKRGRWARTQREAAQDMYADIDEAREHYLENQEGYHEDAIREAEAAGVAINFGNRSEASEPTEAVTNEQVSHRGPTADRILTRSGDVVRYHQVREDFARLRDAAVEATRQGDRAAAIELSRQMAGMSGELGLTDEQEESLSEAVYNEIAAAAGEVVEPASPVEPIAPVEPTEPTPRPVEPTPDEPVSPVEPGSSDEPEPSVEPTEDEPGVDTPEEGEPMDEELQRVLEAGSAGIQEITEARAELAKARAEGRKRRDIKALQARVTALVDQHRPAINEALQRQASHLIGMATQADTSEEAYDLYSDARQRVEDFIQFNKLSRDRAEQLRANLGRRYNGDQVDVFEQPADNPRPTGRTSGPRGNGSPSLARRAGRVVARRPRPLRRARQVVRRPRS